MDAPTYQAAIPKRCMFQTAELHADQLGLCWGLLSSIKAGVKMNCDGCEYASRSAPKKTEEDA